MARWRYPPDEKAKPLLSTFEQLETEPELGSTKADISEPSTGLKTAIVNGNLSNTQTILV